MPHELPLGDIRRTTAVDSVRLRVTTSIAMELLAPGERLPPPELAAPAFGVSAMSVRRAYRELEADGLVRRARGRNGGTFVADAPGAAMRAPAPGVPTDRAHIHALIDQRAALETGLAVAVALRDDRAGELDPLRDLVDAMAGADDWASFRTLDARFHDELAAAALLPAAAALRSRVATELSGYFVPYRMSVLHRSNDQHREILDAIAAGDTTSASALAFHHVLELRGTRFTGAQRGETTDDARPE